MNPCSLVCRSRKKLHSAPRYSYRGRDYALIGETFDVDGIEYGLVWQVGSSMTQVMAMRAFEAGEGPAWAFSLPDAPGIWVEVKRAEGRKCARSWKISTEVGADPRYPDLTPRDAEAVAAWDAAHGR